MTNTQAFVRLREKLDLLPRLPLVAGVTPLHELPRLSASLEGPRIWVKRDDLTGLALGGNKVRQMEFFIGAALAQRADVLIGGGSFAQSNHARICAAASRVAGIEPVIIVRPGGAVASMSVSGNALLTRLLCEDIRVVQELADVPQDRIAEVEVRRRIFDTVAEEYRAKGRSPYCLYGSSSALGVMGYLAATLELQQQMDALGIRPDWVVVTSMGATQAGLELGCRLLGCSWRVAGMAYMPANGQASNAIAELMNEAARLLSVDITVTSTEIVNYDNWAGPAYGVPSKLSREAMQVAASKEGLVLDPVYSAKGMGGLLGAIRAGRFGARQEIVFVHTGGQPALFAYGEDSFEACVD